MKRSLPGHVLIIVMVALAATWMVHIIFQKLTCKENWDPPASALVKFLSRYADKGVDVYLPGGNRGDGLIYAGAFRSLKQARVNYTPFRDHTRPPRKHDVLLFMGGGGFCAYWNRNVHNFRRLLQDSHYSEYVILPTTFDTSHESVANFLRDLSDNVTIFCREKKSYKDVVHHTSCKVILSHDTAAYTDVEGYLEKGSGTVYAIRDDKEGNPAVLTEFASKRKADLSIMGAKEDNDWQNFLRDVAKYECVHTNRAHVAFAATLLDKRTYIYDCGYFKVRAIYDYSLAGSPNTRFVNLEDGRGLIRKYFENSSVTTLDDKISRARLRKFRVELKDFDLPTARVNHALHYERDREAILRKYPYIFEDSHDFKQRPGAYGLAASFIQFIHENLTSEWSVWYEDDTRPAGKKTVFEEQLLRALKKLPTGGADVYSFSRTTNCNKPCTGEQVWKHRSSPGLGDFIGTTTVLFSKDALGAILRYSTRKGVRNSIDKFLNLLSQKKIINMWDWNGNTSKNKMFCGLFTQADTFCGPPKHRKNNLMDMQGHA